MTVLDIIKEYTVYLITISQIVLILYTFEFNAMLFHDQIYPYYKIVFKDLDEERIRKLVDITYWAFITGIILFTALFQLLYIKDNKTAVLVSNILIAMTLFFGLFQKFINEDIELTVRESVLLIIEIGLGFYYVLFIKTNPSLVIRIMTFLSLFKKIFNVTLKYTKV